MVSLRVLTIADDEACLIEAGHILDLLGLTDVRRFVTRVSDQAPHLEYIATPFDHAVKRVSGEWDICDATEFPSFPF
jgi:hypothetical protein